MELIPDRATYAPGDEIVIELSSPLSAAAELTVFRLQAVVQTVSVPAGAQEVRLGMCEPGGYGVRLWQAASAFDVLGSPFERPRYGFVVRLTDDVNVAAVTRNFRRNHLNLAQLYDWGYRHSQLMPPTDQYVDPLGQVRDIAVVNRMSLELRAAGALALGYSAVYAIGHDETDAWRDSLLLRPDGAAYRLGADFLVLVDPGEPAWLAHYLEQLAVVVAKTELAGFHLDQYGWPKFAHRADGTRVDLAEAYPRMLAAVRERLPDVPFMFNNVNDFPTYATATAPQDAHSTLQDLGALATTARALRPEHPPILSAYLSCYADDEGRANVAASLVMATAWSHGASHLLLGEDGNVLTAPYYPDNHRLEASSAVFFARWYDFQVRYGDLFYDQAQVDVTEFFTGGINNDLVFSGATFSTKAHAGSVWTRVVRTSHGLVVHLVNLVGQTDTLWDAGKNDVQRQSGICVTVAPVAPDARIWFADVDAPDMRELQPSASGETIQLDALSASQSSVRFDLPDVGAWAILLIPAGQLH
jgi:dextranase